MSIFLFFKKGIDNCPASQKLKKKWLAGYISFLFLSLLGQFFINVRKTAPQKWSCLCDYHDKLTHLPFLQRHCPLIYTCHQCQFFLSQPKRFDFQKFPSITMKIHMESTRKISSTKLRRHKFLIFQQKTTSTEVFCGFQHIPQPFLHPHSRHMRSHHP